MKVFYLFFVTFFISIDSHAGQIYKGSAGAGLGMVYGLVGIKLEYSVIEDANIALGLGNEASAGFQYYFRDQKDFWRPRVSLFYGPVSGIVMVRGTEEIDENFLGAAIEIGQILQFGTRRRHALEFGITIPLTDGGGSDREAELKVQGYSHCCGANFGEILYYFNVGYRYNYRIH